MTTLHRSTRDSRQGVPQRHHLGGVSRLLYSCPAGGRAEFEVRERENSIAKQEIGERMQRSEMYVSPMFDARVLFDPSMSGRRTMIHCKAHSMLCTAILVRPHSGLLWDTLAYIPFRA